jgi:hypothetical protein
LHEVAGELDISLKHFEAGKSNARAFFVHGIPRIKSQILSTY